MLSTEQRKTRLQDYKAYKASKTTRLALKSATAGAPKGPADDGKRSEAEWTLYNAGIEERGVPGGEGTAITPETPGQ